MSLPDNDSLRLFRIAAARVANHLASVNFRGWLRSGHLAVGIVGLAAVLVMRRMFGWRENEWWLVVALVSVWLLAGWLVALLRRPDPFRALAVLDDRGGWSDRFSSAWAFLRDEQANEGCGRILHVRRSARRLPEAVGALREAIPLPPVRWVWVLPLMALVFSLSPTGRLPVSLADAPLSDRMRAAAVETGEELKGEPDRLGDAEALSGEERAEWESVRRQVESLADGLADTEGQSAGEVLEAIEERARAAEKLAEKLGLADDGWASEAFVAEMARHSDTADLALAIKDRQAPLAADESDRLHLRLEDPGITEEIEARVTTTLERVMGVATYDDREKPVGERVGNASTKMLLGQPRTAAREFEELAKFFREIARREEARDKLEQLAQRLREAGSEISGSQLQEMEKIAATGGGAKSKSSGKAGSPGGGKGGGKGLQPIDSDPLAAQLQSMQAPQLAKGPPPGQAAVFPGAGKGDPGGGAPVPGQGGEKGAGEKGKGQQPMSAPVPGSEAGPEGSAPGMAAGKGGEKGDDAGTGGMLSAPIPGMNAGAPVPGSGLGSAGSGSGTGAQGGDQAGSGTAELVETTGEVMKAARDARVLAQSGNEGDTVTRAVEGGAREEAAERTRREVVTDFLAVEEQALDGEALPRSRREHVLRYFTEIRRQFEED